MTSRLMALGVLDAAAILVAVLTGAGAGVALAVHALVSSLGYAAWLSDGDGLGFAPALAGIAGPFAILLARPFGRASHMPPADDAVFGPAPAPVVRSGAGLAVARMLDGRVHHAGPDMLGSLVTIMRHGDVAARRRALETVVRSFEPALSPLIALALTDGDQTIRALAAAASARVGQNLAIARATPMTPQSAPARAALFADHARADVLLSDSQRTHLRADAIAMLPAAADALELEALWAAGDYTAIDRLAAAMPDDAAPAMATWWRTQAPA